MGRSITSLDDVTSNNLGTLKKINTECLPTSYPVEWYKDLLNSDQISKLAYYSELPVGGVKAKLVNLSNELSSFDSVTNSKLVPKMVPNMVYIETFAVLKSYRNLGIGKQLLEFLIEETKQKFIHEICLHVQTTNPAVEWYLKQGFEKKSTIEGYYTAQNLENPDAYVLSLKV